MSGVKPLPQTRVGRGLLVLLLAAAYLFPAAQRGLWIPDEARYAEVSREMIQGGDWIVPHLLGLVYFEKPVAGYWLNSLAMTLLGETHLAVRLASVLSVWLSAGLVFVLTNAMFGSRRKAWFASLCYLTGMLVYGIGTFAVLDSMLALWLNLALAAFYLGIRTEQERTRRLCYGVLGAALGMAFLTKGFLAFAVVALVALPYLGYRRRLADLRYLALLVPCLLLVALPWSLAIARRAPDYWHYFFWVEHVQRFAADNAQHKAPLWFYVPVLAVGLLPWLGVAPSALRLACADTGARAAVVYLLLWLLLPLLLFSIAKGKLPTYILPCFTPLAVLLGYGLDELHRRLDWRPLRRNGWCNLLFGAALVVGLAMTYGGLLSDRELYAPRELPAWALAVGIFGFWAGAGLLAIRRPQSSWLPTLLAPLVFGVLISKALPAATVTGKMPELFVGQHQALLQQTRYLVADNTGVAYSLAWRLGRDDIRLYGRQGELRYGIQAANAADRSLTPEGFPAWLAMARREGDVALLMVTDAGESLDDLPPADQVVTRRRLTLFYYRAQP